MSHPTNKHARLVVSFVKADRRVPTYLDRHHVDGALVKCRLMARNTTSIEEKGWSEYKKYSIRHSVAKAFDTYSL